MKSVAFVVGLMAACSAAAAIDIPPGWGEPHMGPGGAVWKHEGPWSPPGGHRPAFPFGHGRPSKYGHAGGAKHRKGKGKHPKAAGKHHKAGKHHAKHGKHGKDDDEGKQHAISEAGKKIKHHGLKEHGGHKGTGMHHRGKGKHHGHESKLPAGPADNDDTDANADADSDDEE